MSDQSLLTASQTLTYLNEIEHKIETNNGIYHKKCYKILQNIHFEYINLFENWFIDEEFDDIQLIDEFINNNDYEQSFFIEYLSDKLDDNFSNEDAKNLFQKLHLSLNNNDIYHKKIHQNTHFSSVGMMDNENGNYSQSLVDGCIRNIFNNSLSLFYIFPTDINIVCHRIF